MATTATKTTKRPTMFSMPVEHGKPGEVHQFAEVWRGRCRSARAYSRRLRGQRAGDNVFVTLATNEAGGDAVFCSINGESYDMVRDGEAVFGIHEMYGTPRGAMLPEGAARPPQEILNRIIVALNDTKCQLEPMSDKRTVPEGVATYAVWARSWGITDDDGTVEVAEELVVDLGPLDHDAAKTCSLRHRDRVIGDLTAVGIVGVDIVLRPDAGGADVGVLRLERDGDYWLDGNLCDVGTAPVVERQRSAVTSVMRSR